MMTRDEIASSDLGTFTISGNTIIFQPASAGNFFSKFNSSIAKYDDTSIEFQNYINTIKLIFLNFFQYYADCNMHFTFDKDEIINNMLPRDIENWYLNIYIPSMTKQSGLFAYFDFSPHETIERDYNRTEYAMTENSPINASITNLNNPSGKSRGDGMIDEDVFTTNLYNKVRAIQELAGNLTLKRIVEQELKKYVYELNKIY